MAGVIDLFAGPGGWSEGLRTLGLADVGIEMDRWACATRAAAGHATIRADVAAYPLEVFVGKVEGLIASPPCQDFSAAGRRAGVAGKTGHLVAEVMRWACALRPVWIACEQVPPVLPIWQEYAWRLQQLGYSTWAGLLNAADYGVPQTRVRAFLLAHRERAAAPPERTHCRGGSEAGLWGPGLLPWVSMAETLGWIGEVEKERGAGMEERHGARRNRSTDEPSPTVTAGSAGSGPRLVLHGNRSGAAFCKYGSIACPECDGVVDVDDEQVPGSDRPAKTICDARAPRWAYPGNETTGWTLHTNRDQRENGDRLTVAVDRPAPSVTGKSGGQWTLRSGPRANATVRGVDEPAPVLVAGHQAAGIEWSSDESPGSSVRVSVEEAAILQGFRPDYPWQGTKTARFAQVGNAVPPPLAAAVIGALTGASVG